MIDRSKQLDAVLCAAVELPTADERTKYIRKACAGDSEFQQEVEDLVAAYVNSGNFLETPASEFSPADTFLVTESTGVSIGRYKLSEQIGEGGFAVVFSAEQWEPIRRRIALKVVKPGMDTRQVIARFEAERQALAMMDHPGIAKILDAGTTDAGRPYFVMELVHGTPITQYCDQHCLDIDDRLQLFAQVCDAVQHAHQKGVIHRDIKPSNVLIGTHAGKPCAKVIDFGIAKAMEAPLTDRTLFTEFKQLVGTPTYMSPEQAEGSLDIDTRSDVYSLGVLLYELLSGAPPFDPKDLKAKAVAEMQRIIRDIDPPTPSARLGTLDATTRAMHASARKADPERLARRLRGELDWIALRALEKDRRRRYQSAAALADDISRYLANEPVEARPQTRLYRFRKFARRNKGLLTTLGLLAGVFIGATLLSGWQAIRASQAERQAIADSQRAEAVTDFLVQAFRSPDPDRDGRSITIAEVLDRAVKEVRAKYADDPQLRAALLDALAKTYVSLGLSSSAAPVAEEALKIRTGELGSNSLETLSTMSTLALAYSWTGRHPEAIELAKKELAARRASSSQSTETAWALHRLAMWLRQTGSAADAVPLALEAVDIFKRNLGPTDRRTLNAMDGVVAACYEARRIQPDLSPPYTHKEILEACERYLSDDDTTTLLVMDNAGVEDFEEGRFDAAEKLWQRSLDRKLRKFGPKHGYTLQSFIFLAECYSRPNLDNPQAALDQVDRLMAIRPDIRELKSARLNVLQQIRPIGESAREIAEMLRNEPDQKWTHAPRKEFCRELAKYPEAFGAVVKLLPEETVLWIGRGQLEIQRNEFDKAESSYANVIGKRSLQDEHYEYGCLLLLRGDERRYQQFCNETYERSGTPEDDYSAYVAVRLYGLGPADCISVEQLAQWAERAARDGRAWQLQALGRAYLCAGRYAEAIGAYDKTIPAHDSVGADHGESWFGLAIAHHELGNDVKARRCLMQGKLAIEAARPQAVGSPANVSLPSHWLLLRVMEKEAQMQLR